MPFSIANQTQGIPAEANAASAAGGTRERKAPAPYSAGAANATAPPAAKPHPPADVPQHPPAIAEAATKPRRSAGLRISNVAAKAASPHTAAPSATSIGPAKFGSN